MNNESMTALELRNRFRTPSQKSSIPSSLLRVFLFALAMSYAELKL